MVKNISVTGEERGMGVGGGRHWVRGGAQGRKRRMDRHHMRW
jgi:hypothetical protein